MTILTEKWKAGELEEGYYYIKVNKTLSYVEIDYYHIFGETKYWSGNDEEDICEIIDKVPSYKEYQEIKNGKMKKKKKNHKDVSDKNIWFSLKAKGPDGEVVSLGFPCKKDHKEVENLAKQVCQEKGYEFINMKVE